MTHCPFCQNTLFKSSVFAHCINCLCKSIDQTRKYFYTFMEVASVNQHTVCVGKYVINLVIVKDLSSIFSIEQYYLSEDKILLKKELYQTYDKAVNITEFSTEEKIETFLAFQ